MCVSCLTSVEAMLINAGGLTAAGWYGLRSVAGRVPGLARLAQVPHRERAYAANAEFVASLGLDPCAVLGSPTVAPHPTAPGDDRVLTASLR